MSRCPTARSLTAQISKNFQEILNQFDNPTEDMDQEIRFLLTVSLGRTRTVLKAMRDVKSDLPLVWSQVADDYLSTPDPDSVAPDSPLRSLPAFPSGRMSPLRWSSSRESSPGSPASRDSSPGSPMRSGRRQRPISIKFPEEDFETRIYRNMTRFAQNLLKTEHLVELLSREGPVKEEFLSSVQVLHQDASNAFMISYWMKKPMENQNIFTSLKRVCSVILEKDMNSVSFTWSRYPRGVVPLVIVEPQISNFEYFFWSKSIRDLIFLIGKNLELNPLPRNEDQVHLTAEEMGSLSLEDRMFIDSMPPFNLFGIGNFEAIFTEILLILHQQSGQLSQEISNKLAVLSLDLANIAVDVDPNGSGDDIHSYINSVDFNPLVDFASDGKATRLIVEFLKIGAPALIF